MYWQRLQAREHREKGDLSGAIYGLVDPKDNQLRYVGRTVREPGKRFREHLAGENGRNVYRWTSSLKNAGLIPTMVIIEEYLTPQQCIEAEHFWIMYFKAMGADLTNMDNTKVNGELTRKIDRKYPQGIMSEVKQ